MRKLLLTFSVLLILVALAGPRVTGHYAEKLVREGQPYVVDGLPEWVQLVEHSYERGWFTANATHRLLITDPQRAGMLQQWLDDGDFGDQPAIVMTSKVTHGLFVNLLTPAFARVDSNFVVDGGQQQRALPAILRTTIGLGSTTQFTIRMADGALQRDDGALGWSNAHLDYIADPTAQGPLIVTLHADSLNMTTAGDPMTPEGQQIDLVDADATLAIAIAPSAANATLDYSATKLGNPITSGAMTGSASIDNITQSTITAVQTIARAMSAPAGQTVPMLDSNTDLLRQGFAQPVDVSWRHALSTAGGTQDIELDLTTAALSGMPAALSSQALFSAFMENSETRITANASGDYLAGLGDENPTSKQQVAMLKGMGALIGNDTDGYSMQLNMDNGVITVNGSPLPTFAPSR